MKIYVIGTGPGEISQMTGKALCAIKNSDVIIGYNYYIELIRENLQNKEIYFSGMGKEIQRCQKALECALEGKKVSVISSGDAGVYGMAGIMHEICRDYGNIKIEVISGVTACCAAAAVLGAPISHDFAVISLSDLLTPWEKIEKRIRCASEADFVICIYNPASRKRAGFLKRACEYMLEYKSPDTPCGYVKNIAREGQEHKICTLFQLKDEETDMFTTVIVGNSQTKIINGKLVTPRGYKL